MKGLSRRAEGRAAALHLEQSGENAVLQAFFALKPKLVAAAVSARVRVCVAHGCVERACCTRACGYFYFLLERRVL